VFHLDFSTSESRLAMMARLSLWTTTGHGLRTNDWGYFAVDSSIQTLRGFSLIGTQINMKRKYNLLFSLPL